MDPNPYKAPEAALDRNSKPRPKWSLLKYTLVAAALGWGVYCFASFFLGMYEMARIESDLSKRQGQPAAKPQAPSMWPPRRSNRP